MLIDDEGDGEHQRNRQRHHDAGAPAERNEADQQHDAQGLGEGFGEFADGMIDDVRLVGDLLEVDALRQRRFDLLHRGFDILAELDDVGALGHDDADAERRLAALTHEIARRILEAARYRRDVAEAEARAAEFDRRVGDGLGAVDGAGDAQRHALRAGLDGACRDHGILLCQRIEDRLRRNSKRGELGVAEFDEDLLVLHAIEIDLGDVLHLEQLLAHGLGHALQLRVVGAVGGQRVEDGVDVAVFVVDVGADHVRRAGRSGCRRASCATGRRAAALRGAACSP